MLQCPRGRVSFSRLTSSRALPLPCGSALLLPIATNIKVLCASAYNLAVTHPASGTDDTSPGIGPSNSSHLAELFLYLKKNISLFIHIC